MIALRRSTVLADTHVQKRAHAPETTLVRVGADATDWYYTDSNGKLWAFSDRGDGVPAGERFVASTGTYADSTYKFYDSTKEALTTTVDNLARSKAAEEAGAADLATFSTAVESEEGPIVEQDATSRMMADEGISEDAAVKKQVQKKAATAVPKSPPTAAGMVALKAIQSSLMKLGYDLGAKYGADGKIGPFTRAAITKFKKDNGLTPTDSTINPAFIKALNDAANGGDTGGGGGTNPSTSPEAAAIGSSGASTGIIVAIVATVVAVGMYFLMRKP